MHTRRPGSSLQTKSPGRAGASVEGEPPEEGYAASRSSASLMAHQGPSLGPSVARCFARAIRPSGVVGETFTKALRAMMASQPAMCAAVCFAVESADVDEDE